MSEQMMIYEPLVADGYEWVNCRHDEDYEIFSAFDGSPRLRTWTPVEVTIVKADQGQSFHPSDFPWLGSDALVLRPRAVAALMGLISGNAEVLPLLSDEGAELFVLNVTCVIDALDQERSEVLRFPGGRIMLIKQPVFKQDLLNGVELFRLPHRASSTYVGSNFVTAVRAAGLEGLEFREAKTS